MSEPVTLDDLRVLAFYDGGINDILSRRERRTTLEDLIQVLKGMGAEVGPPHQLVVTLLDNPDSNFLLLPLTGVDG